jgi:hypothetical protein
MKKRALLLFSATAMIALPAMAWAQGTRYPVTIIPPGKGPYTFPDGYQTPWDKIDIMVTEKISPNLFILHGSQGLDLAHPDASGGRAMVLFGTDGVLLVDTENRQVAEKTLKAIRSFTDAPIKVMVNSHIHSDHTGANAFLARQGALIFAQENLRDEMLRPPLLASGQLAPAPDLAGCTGSDHPGRTDGHCSLVRSHQYQPSPKFRRVGSCITLFEACSAFTTLRPARSPSRHSDPLHRRLRRLCYLRRRSDCYRVERTAPGRDFHSLWTNAFSRRTELSRLGWLGCLRSCASASAIGVATGGAYAG